MKWTLSGDDDDDDDVPSVLSMAGRSVALLYNSCIIVPLQGVVCFVRNNFGKEIICSNIGESYVMMNLTVMTPTFMNSLIVANEYGNNLLL